MDVIVPKNTHKNIPVHAAINATLAYLAAYLSMPYAMAKLNGKAAVMMYLP
jgi:hypothetical protein